MSEGVRTSAVLSGDERYRYHLCRWWGDGPRVTFVMLNPSKADATVDDPTIVRCMGFARGWGYDGIDVVNLYAFRATKPVDLWTARSLAIDVIGASNDAVLRVIARQAVDHPSPLIAAWGANAEPGRVAAVMQLPFFHRALHLGLTKGGMPKHPLYLAGDTRPEPYVWRSAA